MREMTVYGVSLDMRSRQPIVLLKTTDDDVYVPVWVGHSEAAAILMKLQDSEPPAPADARSRLLARRLARRARSSRVTVTGLRDNTFHASVTLATDGREIEVDSRTSDAIALALRAGAPIFAADDVVEESGVEFEDGEPVLEQAQGPPELGDVDMSEFRRFLDSVSPDEFADGPDEPGRRVAAAARVVRDARPPRASSGRAARSTSRSRPSSLSGPSLAAASAALSARSRPGIDVVDPLSSA